MGTLKIFGECQRAGLTLQVDGANIRVKPAANLTDDLQAILREHKQELIEALAVRQINFVSCGSCAHWEGTSPCGAGMVTSGDPFPGIRARLCGFHMPRRMQ